MRLALLALIAPLVAAAPIRRSDSAITSNVADVAAATWDWIIVGGGLGGLVTANRLSAEGLNVLVVEAGGDNRTSNLVQTINTYGQAFSTELNWAYQAKNQVGGDKTVNAGHTLGGSTSINGGAWGRPSKAELDALAEYTGDQTFSWDNILPYMEKAERFHAPTEAQRALGAGADWDVHGYDGPIDVSYTPAVNATSSRRDTGVKGSFQKRMYTDAYGQDYLTAAKNAIGLRQIYDVSNGDNYGVGATTTNSITPTDDPTAELRSSAATGYLSPIEYSKPNLKVLIGWRGVRPAFQNATSTRVTGAFIQATQGGEVVRLHAKKGVVVSAGALGSPQFLERGGIGDPAVLNPLGVKMRVPLPAVGKNLQDQTMKSLGYAPGTPFKGHGPSATITFPNIYQLFHNASDMRTYLQQNADSWAQATVKRGGSVSTKALKTQWAAIESLLFDRAVGAFEGFVDHGFPSSSLGTDCWNLFPLSRGSVHISSSDPFDPPHVDPGYFTVPFDLDLSIAGWRAARKIYHTAPLNYTLGQEVTPASEVPIDNNMGAYADWARWGLSSYAAVAHQVGSLQMAPRHLGGVVRSDGSVYGVAESSLRVIDGSVLPYLISSHLSAPLYGIAEKLAADLIK